MAPSYPWRLGELMAREAHRASNLAQWKVARIPPLRALPEITLRPADAADRPENQRKGQ
ncbi:MAG: hypothetical protein NTZ64_04315 [Polaromonas sp.]|nr:hypothetical protein [Polaromonas sp.]